MISRRLIFSSLTLCVFGLCLLIIGSIILISRDKEKENTRDIIFTKVSGQVICIISAFIIIASLATLLYTCILGATYVNMSSDYVSNSSQLEKAACSKTRPYLTSKIGMTADLRLKNNKQSTGNIDGQREGDTSQMEQLKNQFDCGMTTNWSNSTQSKQFQRLGNRRRCCSTGLSESTLITNIPNISLKPIMDITNPLQTTSSSVNKYNDSNYILLAATNSSNIQSNFNNTSTTHNLLDGGINSYITLSNTERNPVLYPSSRLRLGEIF